MFHHFCFQWCKNFPKWKTAIFLDFFSFFIIFFLFVHHFCFQWCKHFQKNGKLQFSSSFFHFFIIFYHCFFIFHHFCFQWCKNFPKNGKLQFSSVVFHLLIIFLSFVYLFFSCFIILASSGAKIFQKIENCNFSRVFFICLSFFYHCFIIFFIFHHFCFQWCKNFPKN